VATAKSGGRSKLALEVADLTETPDRLRVLIRHGKTDREGRGGGGHVAIGPRVPLSRHGLITR
jgi:hypothetical protein